MSFASTRINEIFPGSSGGVIEAVKRGLVLALREALNATTLSDDKPGEGEQGTPIHVDLEYPIEQTQYPGIWVQFSLSTLRPSGLGMAVQDHESGDVLQQCSYTGRVTLYLVALTSIARDRLADYILAMLAFSRIPNPNLFTENGFTDSFSPIYSAFQDNPYISMTVNSDEIRPGGQSVTVGVPWDDSQIAYEDSYSFDVQGEFMLVTTNGGYYRIQRIDIEPQLASGIPVDDEGWM